MKGEIFFDMDGVIADFYKVVEPEVGEIDKRIDHSRDAQRARQMRKSIINFMIHEDELFANLPPMPDYVKMQTFARDLIDDGYLVRCLTSTGGYDHATVLKQKLRWLDTYQFPHSGVIFVHNGKFKAELAHPQALLIDDFALNTEEFEKAGGHVILHENADETIETFYDTIAENLSDR